MGRGWTNDKKWIYSQDLDLEQYSFCVSICDILVSGSHCDEWRVELGYEVSQQQFLGQDSETVQKSQCLPNGWGAIWGRTQKLCHSTSSHRPWPQALGVVTLLTRHWGCIWGDGTSVGQLQRWQIWHRDKGTVNYAFLIFSLYDSKLRNLAWSLRWRGEGKINRTLALQLLCGVESKTYPLNKSHEPGLEMNSQLWAFPDLPLLSDLQAPKRGVAEIWAGTNPSPPAHSNQNQRVFTNNISNWRNIFTAPVYLPSFFLTVSYSKVA